MFCYDEEGNKLGVINCIPKEGEEHTWGDIAYVCTGQYTTGLGSKNGVIFKKIMLRPFETIVYCDQCGHKWVEERNISDPKVIACKNCDEKVAVL